MKSLYMRPANTEKKAIMNSTYLASYTPFISGDSLDNLSPKQTRIVATNKSTDPWPTSPYMTPYKNGKVMIVTNAGLISLYSGTE